MSDFVIYDLLLIVYAFVSKTYDWTIKQFFDENKYSILISQQFTYIYSAIKQNNVYFNHLITIKPDMISKSPFKLFNETMNLNNCCKNLILLFVKEDEW